MSGREPTVTLRAATAGDRDFLLRVYASTREQELAAVPFTPTERAAFLEQQFIAQSAHYEREGNGSTFDVVLVDGEPAGRLIVGRWEREVRVVDIALLPEYRGHGVGGRLLREVLEEAVERGVVASIHVERDNGRALAFYERLGFERVAETGLYVLLECPAPPGAGQAKIAS